MTKTLIIGPSWVGDMMMSQSLYRTLKSRCPEQQIDVMAPQWCRPLLARMPEVNHAIEMPIGHGSFAFGQRKQLGNALKNHHYQHAYVLPNSFKSALIPWFADIPKRTGWLGEMRYFLLNDWRKLDKQAFPLMVERYVALAYPKEDCHSAKALEQPLLRPQLSVATDEIPAQQHAFNLSSEQTFIGFCPGAEFGPAKRWPDYHYATLAKSIIATGATILIFGSNKDHAVAEEIREQLSDHEKNHCINLAGKTALDQAIVLIAGCRAIVTNDSGLMHVAAALNIPLVALYGPTSPDFTPPLSDYATIIRHASGYHKIRKGDSEQGYHQSLIDITPQEVFQALEQRLADK